MSDHEMREYVDDYTNLQYIPIGKAINLDDGFILALNEPIGSTLVRKEINNFFYSIAE